MSARRHWVRIEGQRRPFEMSRVDLLLDPYRHRVEGTTDNVSVLALDVGATGAETFALVLDGDSLSAPVDADGLLTAVTTNAWIA